VLAEGKQIYYLVRKFALQLKFPSSLAVSSFPHLTYRPKHQEHKRKTLESVTRFTHTTTSAADFITCVFCEALNMSKNSEAYVNNVLFTSNNGRYKDKESNTLHGGQEVAIS